MRRALIALSLLLLPAPVLPQSVDPIVMMSAAMGTPQCGYRNLYDWWHYRLTCRFVDKNGHVYYEHRQARRW